MRHWLLFLKDEKFTQSLEIAKKEFGRIYLSLKNPSEYSKEALLSKYFYRDFSCQGDK